MKLGTVLMVLGAVLFAGEASIHTTTRWIVAIAAGVAGIVIARLYHDGTVVVGEVLSLVGGAVVALVTTQTWAHDAIWILMVLITLSASGLFLLSLREEWDGQMELTWVLGLVLGVMVL